MNGVRVSPAPSGCTCPPSGGFGAEPRVLHFTTYTACDLNKSKACDHEHAHKLMQRCGFCGWVDPKMVVVPVEELQRLLQHVQLTRDCCREAAQPVRDLIDKALAP